MGNSESAFDDPHHDFLHQTPSYAGTSMDPDYRHRGQLPYIADNFNSLDQVTDALRESGLESSNLILGIDFTKSNEWTGRHSFHRKSLHAISNTPNPYEQAISIIGRTLSPFDEDNLIPCFGFGDASTHDKYVFSFYPDHRYCRGFEEVLARYKEIVPYLKLSGPTSFAPIIDAAIDIVEGSNGQYHVLVIIADGQVSGSLDGSSGRFSPQEQATVNSIVAASRYPLSIILVGVGDGPWDAMKLFDDNIPQRSFDNFQFVDFSKIMSENMEASKKETAFALSALMEIPFQYRATLRLQSIDNNLVGGPRTRPLPPPQEVLDHDREALQHMMATTLSVEAVEQTAPVDQVCPICLTNPKNMAFGCGHLTCKECGESISLCPLCREPINTRLKLYS
ncbi:E3 ubiquitin-protein ligase RGLG3 isoform X1 [Vitis vinifera]|uniref:E3 ubiquitin-protein ligase RGLG3 isoform X1 n=1 Tax=Vitis vinifera TaxID=29760 RepID=UPI00015CC7CB|nr:E3 ubiquitin-protein ligase RGLG3 isoform X1 [Vitis vinifera]XP_003631931.1 E3 ubiquitin-protein ligase RGLG3 isoform X1 [Vitis vinifera]|eukprot:XP_002266834.1 PREDICTED: E3 ubiquitin-protein ligase RGLG1 isoform X1 [Vitis vinifera]